MFALTVNHKLVYSLKWLINYTLLQQIAITPNQCWMKSLRCRFYSIFTTEYITWSSQQMVIIFMNRLWPSVMPIFKSNMPFITYRERPDLHVHYQLSQPCCVALRLLWTPTVALRSTSDVNLDSKLPSLPLLWISVPQADFNIAKPQMCLPWGNEHWTFAHGRLWIPS